MKSVSVLKETIKGENRVILTPDNVKELTKGYCVYVEKGAGVSLGYMDVDYEKVGAQITSKEKCWRADFILKYKGPTKDEYNFLSSKTKIAAIFHAEGNYKLLQELKDREVTAYSYKFIETSDGFFPLAYSGGEIAGKMAILYALYFQQNQFGGRGKALFSIRGGSKGKIGIIGYGNVGGAAIKMASSMGNEVHIFGRNIDFLKKLSVHMDEGVFCHETTEENLKKILPQMDAIIGAILISTYDTPPLITNEIFGLLKPGTVVIDVTCGYGEGYIPNINQFTTLDKPTYVTEGGIVCCKIANFPSAYPVSTTEVYSNNAIKWIKKMIDMELLGYLNEDVGRGQIFDRGKIVHDVIREHWEYYENEDNII